MRKRDTFDVLMSSIAVAVDAAAVFGGLLLATWIRFDSGWIAIRHQPPPNYRTLYTVAAVVVTLGYLLVLRSLRLYVRPQTGSFVDKIPRLVRGCVMGVVMTAIMAFAVLNEFDFSRLVIGISGGTVLFCVLLERYLLFRIEWNLARHSKDRNRVVIVGTDEVARRLWQSLHKEPMFRASLVGFLATGGERDPGIAATQVVGNQSDLAAILEDRDVDQLILTDTGLGHQRIVEIIVLCEQHLVAFNMVPDLFRVMTSSMDVQSLDDIPLLGLSAWPLDVFWRRTLKRAEDIVGAAVGLVLTAPVMALAALLVKRSSPGPVFYRQERCGESGRPFVLYKLRTMRRDAETDSGPVFTDRDDPRVTPVGAFLRRHNLDELPQLWNVLRGDMSLVGPRPERPHFVEQFKTDIGRYMRRHVSKPGMTGWAQVNGLRGQTSIEQRIKYDLYYLENWSLAFDFKILMKTLTARENAY